MARFQPRRKPEERGKTGKKTTKREGNSALTGGLLPFDAKPGRTPCFTTPAGARSRFAEERETAAGTFPTAN